MDDFDFDSIDFLPGVDLYLWLRVVLAVIGLAAVVALAVAA